MKLANVWDTQIGYAVVQRQQNAGQTPLPVGLNTLLRKYAQGRENPYKDSAREQMEAGASLGPRRIQFLTRRQTSCTGSTGRSRRSS